VRSHVAAAVSGVALVALVIVVSPSDAETKRTSTPTEATESACPSDMLEIDGDYCPFYYQHCLEWLSNGPPDAPKLRCAEFRRGGGCMMPTQHKHFCIDRYEWPNRRGAVPPVSLDWFEAKRSCASIGKRLCNDDEWTLACEGPERLPYPYGYSRNSKACNIDKEYRWPVNDSYTNPYLRASEIARLDQREPSGSRESCVSAYGVYDMTGNVDEWVMNETQQCKPHCSGLKGGAWTAVRNRCRPMTTFHGESDHFYEIGFRCCAEARKKQSEPPSDNPY
jgi:hypothetical protein